MILFFVKQKTAYEITGRYWISYCGSSDLCLIQWVSPLFSRLIFDAGYKTVQDVASAHAEDLVVGVSTVNKKENLFKGKIGARDMGRLVYIASILPHELEL